MKAKAIALEIICALLIILFVYAALNKLADVQKFNVQIRQSPLLTRFAPALAWGIPFIEILVAIGLGAPRFRLNAFYAAFGLMVAFTAYITAILQYSDHIPCACGGVLQNLGWHEHLIFNIVFTAFACIGIFLCPSRVLINEKKISDFQTIG